MVGLYGCFYLNKTDVFGIRITNWSYKSSDLLNESFDTDDEMQQISSKWYIKLGVSGEYWKEG